MYQVGAARPFYAKPRSRVIAIHAKISQAVNLISDIFPYDKHSGSEYLALIKLPRMSEKEIDEIVSQQFLCRIAFTGEEYPYIAPFQYVSMNRTIYLHFTDYGRKMKLIEKNKKVCVEIETFTPNMSRYVFVVLKGEMSIVEDPKERDEVIYKMVKTGKQKLSPNFLAAHGLSPDKGWDSLSHEEPLVIFKLEKITEKTGLKSPDRSNVLGKENNRMDKNA